MKKAYLLLIILLKLQITQAHQKPVWSFYSCTQKSTFTDTVINNAASGNNNRCKALYYEFHNSAVQEDPSRIAGSAPALVKQYTYPYYIDSNVYGSMRSYTDANGIEWGYFGVSGKGTNADPELRISMSSKVADVCLEIPLLHYKLVLFRFDDEQMEAPDSTYMASLHFEGTKFILELRKEYISPQPKTPVIKSWTYETKYLFEERSSYFFTLAPNPFNNKLTLNLPVADPDSVPDLRMVIKDWHGKIYMEQNITQTVTLLNTSNLPAGQYIIFIFRKEEILDYANIMK